MKRSVMVRLRAMIEKAAESLSDADAIEAVQLFPMWRPDTDYEVGDRRQFGGILWKCILNHHSQSSWLPNVSPSLWVRTDNPADEWPEWVQPQGSTDAYMTGDKVSHNSKHWINEVDYNTWEPGVYGWTEQN